MVRRTTYMPKVHANRPCTGQLISSSGKWQAWLAMEEHNGMDSVSVGSIDDGNLSYITDTES